MVHRKMRGQKAGDIEKFRQKSNGWTVTVSEKKSILKNCTPNASLALIAIQKSQVCTQMKHTFRMNRFQTCTSFERKLASSSRSWEAKSCLMFCGGC